jgi:hypothetical protein
MVRDRLRELLVRTAYDKADRLEVPVFAEKNKTKRVPVLEEVIAGMPLDSASAGAAAVSLAAPARALARALAWDVRFEPLNDTPLHRGYPSPRSLFPASVDLVFSLDSGASRCRYEPSHHALLPLTPLKPDAAPPAKAGLRIEIVAELERIAPLYCDLAPTLCALEAGHLAQQVCEALLAEGLAFTCRRVAGPPPNDVSAPLPLVEIELAERFVAPQAFDFSTPLRVARHSPLDADRPLVLRARSWLDCPPAPALAIAQAGPGAPVVPAGNACERSSGNFVHGMRGRPASDEQLRTMIDAVADAYAVFSGDDGLCVTLLQAMPDLEVVAKRLPLGGSEQRFANGWAPLGDAYGTLYNIDLQTVPLVVALSAPFGRLLRDRSSWTYVQLLTTAGMISQRICASAARLGFFARPFKGMVEKQLESAFDIEGQCFYSLLLGKAGPYNPCFSVSALPPPGRQAR